MGGSSIREGKHGSSIRSFFGNFGSNKNKSSLNVSAPMRPSTGLAPPGPQYPPGRASDVGNRPPIQQSFDSGRGASFENPRTSPLRYQQPPPPPPVAIMERPIAKKPKLIIGIDFGTTFSGVAFAFTTDGGVKEGIITEWPGAGNQSRNKVPTILYYDKEQNIVGWGLEFAGALAPSGYPKPGVQKIEWFKMQLMQADGTYLKNDKLPPLPSGKTPIDVTADYLIQLRKALRIQLQKILGEAVYNRHEDSIHYYLTVPAIWNDAGKAATKRAAIQAGLVRAESDSRVTLISEPEAAAMFCSKTGLLNLKIMDAVLVVDCGGGTVDLIAYEVTQEEPLTLVEATTGSGDSCGSTAVNRNFSGLLRRRIDLMKLPPGTKTGPKIYAKCLSEFENRIKADFRNNGQVWAIDIGVETDYPEAGVEEGYMSFTDAEILECYRPVVHRILELVKNQITAIQTQNRHLQNVLVVGGFGGSEFLFQEIKDNVPQQYQHGVVRPMDAVAAVVKGAVTAGVSQSLVTARVARRHYLMATLTPFKPGYHKEEYRVPSLDGNDRCKFTRHVFVNKGQRITIGEPVKISFFRQVAAGSSLTYSDILYVCDMDNCPEYITDPGIRPLVTLTSDLSRKSLERDFQTVATPQGMFYKVYFDIYLTLDGSEFSAEVVCQGEIMGACQVKFE